MPSNTPTQPSGHVYYVATGGNDANSGSLDLPFRTVAKGLTALSAGDTLVLHGGEYTENINVKLNKGTSAQPITVTNFPGEQPVIRGLFWLSDADYWMIDGINVTWLDGTASSNHMVKMSGGNGWVIRNCEFWGAHSYAALLISGGATNFYVGYNTLHDTYLSNAINQDHLIYANNAINGVIERNLLYNSPNGRAIKVGSTSATVDYPRQITVRYNTMYNNLGPSNIQFSYAANNNQAYRNILEKPRPGEYNITSSSLIGANNRVYDNIGWESAGVVEPGAAGLLDDGGNLQIDPQLNNPGSGNFTPQNNTALIYGRMAP